MVTIISIRNMNNLVLFIDFLTNILQEGLNIAVTRTLTETFAFTFEDLRSGSVKTSPPLEKRHILKIVPDPRYQE